MSKPRKLESAFRVIAIATYTGVVATIGWFGWPFFTQHGQGHVWASYCAFMLIMGIAAFVLTLRHHNN